LNRVEGDLKIQIEVVNGCVSEAWSIGTMYRGFENLLVGRAPMDGLVITPRICGICSTAHLKAAAKALDMIFNTKVPDNAKRVRNVTLMVEQMQSDIRHAFLLHMPDFTNGAYKRHSLYEEALRRYEPFRGESVVQAIRETKKILEIIAILGGQWPHSSFMVPGGVVSLPSKNELIQCRYLLKSYQKWYENRVLGCAVERWQEVSSQNGLDSWLEERSSHRESDLGFFVRFSKMASMDKLGKGYEDFISFGSMDMPEETEVVATGRDRKRLFPSGISSKGENKVFEQERITEDVSHSWFLGDEGGNHPFKSLTEPYASGSEGEKYTWAKAPRYDGLPAETGPLAEMIIGSNPLFKDLMKTDGPNVFNRELARIVRSAAMIPILDIWLKELIRSEEDFYEGYEKIEER